MTQAEMEMMDDPFLRYIQRDPLPGAGVRVIRLAKVLTELDEAILAPLVAELKALGREVETRTVTTEGIAHSDALRLGLEGATEPLALVTTADEPWTAEHLGPLIEAIDHCDHVIGRRPPENGNRWLRWVGSLPRRFIFAVPLQDIHSPCRLHRREKLQEIVLESASSMIDLEILAKATFFGHLIDEVPVPALASTPRTKGWWRDWNHLFKNPCLDRGSSGPAEDAEGDQEADDGPDGHDQDGGSDVDQGGTLEHHAAEGADKLGERKRLDQRLNQGGEALGGEENARAEPHGNHDGVHESTDGLGAVGTRGDQQADAGEGQGANDVDDDHRDEPAADGHLKHEDAE